MIELHYWPTPNGWKITPCRRLLDRRHGVLSLNHDAQGAWDHARRVPQPERWFPTLRAREALQRGLAVGKDWKRDSPAMDEKARNVVFGQTAASTARQ